MTYWEKSKMLLEWQEANYPLGVAAKAVLVGLPDKAFVRALDNLEKVYQERRYENA